MSVIDFRIDANTYRKEYLASSRLLCKLETSSIADLSISIQNFGAYSLCNYINFQDEGIPFLMTKNIRENFIDWNIEKHVDKESHDMLWKSHCSRGQVLVTMAGEYLGRVAVYDKDEICSSNQAIAKITLKEGQSPYAVSTFLNSKYGQHQIQRFRTITGQPNINMGLIESLIVPKFSGDFCLQIENLMQVANRTKENSFCLYQQAEQVLLSYLDFNNYTPTDETVNIQTYKNSFLMTGRLDAEYYQPKYQEMINQITSKPNSRLTDLVHIQKSIEPGSDVYTEDEEGMPFLRVADYSKHGTTKPQKRLAKSFVVENKAKISALKPKKNSILFSKDGSVGEAYRLRDDADFITSGAILNLVVKDENIVLPEYLTLALNSVLVRTQAERDAGGSIILHWRVDEINNVLVPIVNSDTQHKIASTVEESFKLKAESERLLDVAKRAVELYIEQNESAALSYIDAEMQKNLEHDNLEINMQKIQNILDQSTV